jgi:hypothetical protein
MTFFYINDKRELGFQHLSTTASEGGGGWFWVGLQNMWLNNTLSWYFTVSIGGEVGRFVPMVMVVERGDATGVLGLFQILESYSQFCYVVLCTS